jgi:DNA invertase Pin-like site-specific DNA recombinase
MALYARAASVPQHQQGTSSSENQITALFSVCRQQNWVAANVIKDEGYAGTNLYRPGISALRKLARTGKIDAVLCTHIDRLGRSFRFQQLANELGQHGIDIISLNQTPGRNITLKKLPQTGA